MKKINLLLVLVLMTTALSFGDIKKSSAFYINGIDGGTTGSVFQLVHDKGTPTIYIWHQGGDNDNGHERWVFKKSWSPDMFQHFLELIYKVIGSRSNGAWHNEYFAQIRIIYDTNDTYDLQTTEPKGISHKIRAIELDYVTAGNDT